MIPHDAFSKFKASEYRAGPYEGPSKPWDFGGQLWVCSFRGSEIGIFSRTEEPDRLAAITLELGLLPPGRANDILDALQVPLRLGSSLDEIIRALGLPIAAHRFLHETLTLGFDPDACGGYSVVCGVHKVTGLATLNMAIPMEAVVAPGQIIQLRDGIPGGYPGDPRDPFLDIYDGMVMRRGLIQHPNHGECVVRVLSTRYQYCPNPSGVYGMNLEVPGYYLEIGRTTSPKRIIYRSYGHGSAAEAANQCPWNLEPAWFWEAG